MAYINETLIPRIITLEETVISGSKAFPGTPVIRDAMPYWSNAVDLANVVRVDPDMRNLIYQVTMYLHVDTWQAGFDGTLDGKLQSYIEDVTLFFEKRPGLQVQEYDAWLNWIGPDGCAILRAPVVPLGNETNPQRGIAFVLEVPVMRRLRF